MKISASEIANDGDHHLINAFVQPTLGCQGWLVPDMADPGVKRTALPMNVLQAVLYQPMPVEGLPNTDPMTTTNNAPDMIKLNMYKKGIYQPQIANLIESDPAAFCRNYANITAPRLRLLSANLKNGQSPNGVGTLFDFMKARCIATYAALNCQGLTGVPDPFMAILKITTPPVIENTTAERFNWEEYKNGGYDDGINYRSYRKGFLQPFSKYQ